MAQKSGKQAGKKSKAAAAVRDKHGDVVLWQRPNLWIIAWAVVSFIWLTGAGGSFSQELFGLGTLLLIVWALLELLRGVNLFRRALGAGVLLMILAASPHILSIVFSNS